LVKLAKPTIAGKHGYGSPVLFYILFDQYKKNHPKSCQKLNRGVTDFEVNLKI